LPISCETKRPYRIRGFTSIDNRDAVLKRLSQRPQSGKSLFSWEASSCHGGPGTIKGGDMSVLIASDRQCGGSAGSDDNAPDVWQHQSYACGRTVCWRGARGRSFDPTRPGDQYSRGMIIEACRVSRPSTVHKTEMNSFHEGRPRIALPRLARYDGRTDLIAGDEPA